LNNYVRFLAGTMAIEPITVATLILVAVSDYPRKWSRYTAKLRQPLLSVFKTAQSSS